MPNHVYKVLHVDDDNNLLKLTKLFLERDNKISVTSIDSPVRALEIIPDSDYECIVTDYKMPEMDGITFAKKALEMCDLPVIIYTGQGSEEVAQAAFAAGVSDYLRKELDPSHYQVLAKRIQHIVEQARGGKCLKASEEKFRRFFMNQPVLCYIVSREGNIVDVNDTALDTLGYTREELIGKPVIATLYSPASRGKAEQILSRWVKTGELRNEELNIVSKTGEERTVLLNVDAVKDEGGYVVQSILVQVDITQRKQMADEARTRCEESERYAFILENMNDSVIVTDLDGVVSYWNVGAENIFGYSSEEMIGKSVGSLNLVEEGGAVADSQLDVIKHGESYPTEWKGLKRNGSEVWLLLYTEPLKDHEGNPVGMISVGKDVTQRKLVEESLRESEERYRGLVENSSNAISVTIGDTIVYANKMRAALSGKNDPSELVGTSALSQVVEGDWGPIINVREARERGEKPPSPLEYTMLSADGSSRDIMDYQSEIKYRGKYAVQHMLQDVTEQKKVEEEKSRLLHDLGKRVKELNCLYGLSRLVEKPDVLLDDVLQGTADLLLPAMRYPDITCARIVVDDREFSTKNFKETGLKLQVGIEVFGKNAGFVEVRYLEERLTVAEDPFLKEERLLVDAVAERLGRITERNKTEKILQEKEERLNAIFEGANDGILVADAKTKRFFFANPRICEITGYSLEELLKLSVGDIHPEKDLPYVVDCFTKIQEGKIAYAKDLPVLRKDEKVVYCDLNSKSIKIEGHEYLVGFFRETTESKKAEEALRESEEKLRSVLTASPDAIMIFNLDGRIIDCNESAILLHGYESKEEAVGKNILEHVAQKDHKLALKGLAQGLVKNLELTFVTKNGREYPAEVSGNVVLDALGKPAFFMAITKDITERKKAEEALRESEEKLRSVFAASPDAITVSDPYGRVVDCNPATAALHGYESKEELIGKNVFEFIVKKDHQPIQERMATLGPTKNLEYTFVTKDGREFPVELSANVILDASGKPAYYMGITKDITKRKKMEEQLKANAENLESLLKQRTNELVEAEQLAAAGKVAAMLGHDLRSPIQTIKSSVYLLRESPGESEERLKDIDDAANRMITMVEALRANMRNPPLAPQEVDLGHLITRSLKDASVPPGVTTHLVVGAGLESVTLDPLSMHRVLDNLVRNAFEAMPGGGDLSVSAEVVGSDVVIKVSDTGVGIPEEMRATLFKAFNTSKIGGLGLGLAYCKRAVEAHGGEITVESKVGEGTTFTVILPMNCSIARACD